MSRGTSGSSDAFANVVQADAPPLPPVFPVMVRVSENVHPRGLDFSNQRKVVVLRDVYSKSFVDIAQEVRNVAGGRPSPRTCCQYYQRFSTVAGWKKSQYHQCGRRAWKLTADVRRFLLQRLKKLRQEGLCTCKLLQTELARQKGICVEVSTVQKFLKSQGYKWLPRAQKRRYTAVHMRERKASAHAVLSLGVCRLREKLSFSMDGCVLPLPPKDHTDRLNFLQASDTHMWRLKSERLDPSLAGQDIFSKQSPLDRCVPLWGGLSEGGFSIVTFHQKKKLTKAEWVQLLKAGKVVSAVQSLRPVKAHGPWHVLCDNESFLNAGECHAQYRKLKLHLWQIPPRSPDLNPIERFWAYLRKRLRKLDLQDALRGRPVLGKRAYKARVRTVVKSVHAQTVAKQIAKGYMKTCREVVRKGGAASSG